MKRLLESLTKEGSSWPSRTEAAHWWLRGQGEIIECFVLACIVSKTSCDLLPTFPKNRGSAYKFAFPGCLEKVKELTTLGSRLCMVSFVGTKTLLDPLVRAHALLCTKIHTWWASFSCLTAIVPALGNSFSKAFKNYF